MNLNNRSRVLFDKQAGEILTGNDLGYDGEIIIQQHVQSDALAEWEVNLRVKGFILDTFIFLDNEDGSFNEIRAQSVEQLGETQVKVVFGSPIKGFVNFLISTDAEVV